MNELSKLIDKPLIERVRSHGAIVLDVDDTLLTRKGARSEAQQTFLESPSAGLLPGLLRRGFTLCVITGHGWQQLHARLIAPIAKGLRESGDRADVDRLHVYANRGATKIVWDGTTHKVEEVYGARYQIRQEDLAVLRSLLEALAADFRIDVEARREWYSKSFPRFDFANLPPRVDEREGAVMVLRPIPARFHANAAPYFDIRTELYKRGLDLLRRASLSDIYELIKSGRSSIEIIRRGVSKESAVHDLVSKLAELSGKRSERVEESLVYLGDEFFSDGNDFAIAMKFPTALCLSVGDEAANQVVLANVVQLPRLTRATGTAATEALLSHFLNLST